MRMKRRLKRYEALTQLRQRQEDMKAQVLADAERKLSSVQQERDHLEQQQRMLLEKSVVEKGETIDKEKQLSLHHFERYTARKIIEQDSLIQERKALYKEKRAELKDAIVLRKMMETLSTHAQESIEKEWLRQEQYNMDEIATQRAAQQLQDS